MRLTLSLLAAATLSAACATPAAETTEEKAERLAQEMIVVDGHVDIPYRLHTEWEDISVRTPGGDFDYVRAKAGGMDAPFMSIYVPSALQATPGAAAEHAEKLVGYVERIVAENPDKFMIALGPDDVIAAHEAGMIALPMGMENGAPIENDLEAVDYWYGRGIRYITPAHATTNTLSDSSYDVNRPHGGLSPLGEQVVRRMNEIGMIVDVSHISDEAFWDVMELTDVPVIASHSSARKFTPGFERNMSDEMIRRLADEDGVIMINYGSSFLKGDWAEWRNRAGAAYNSWLAENAYEASAERRAEFDAIWEAENPRPFADLSDVLDHIDHVAAIAGIDTIGLGSDFDGVGDSLPTGLKDAAATPNLIAGLIERGYSDDEIEKILSGNALRVWRAVEAAKTR